MPGGTNARGDREYHAAQGREVGRDSRLELRIDGGGRVWVGGRTVTTGTAVLDDDDGAITTTTTTTTAAQ